MPQDPKRAPEPGTESVAALTAQLFNLTHRVGQGMTELTPAAAAARQLLIESGIVDPTMDQVAANLNEK